MRFTNIVTHYRKLEIENPQLDLRPAADGSGVIIPVKAVPGSSRDRIVGVLGGCLKIATAQPAEKGKANKAIAATLAKALGLPARSVTLTAGPTSPRKEFHAAGLSVDEARARLARVL